MAAEFLKYGGDDLHEAIAVLLNAIFIRHESIPDLKAGLLLALNKPLPKETIVEHTRPIILLIALRKVLSLIVYLCIGGKVGAFSTSTLISPAAALENSFGLFCIFVR